MRSPDAPLDAKGLRIAIVAGEFNADVVEPLVEGALGLLGEAGLPGDEVDLRWVPGAFELPFAARALARTGRYDAVVTLGCVIRGETPHFDYVAGEAARGLMAAQLETGVPMAFGVLTTDTRDQAMDRAGGAHGNKGADAARVAVQMARLVESLGSA